MSRRVVAGGLGAAEVFGPGDLLRPWPQTDDGLLSRNDRWRVHDDVELAVLDRRFCMQAAAWPELLSALRDREVQRLDSLVARLLIAQTPRISDRVYLLLWHLAERWGRVGPEGVSVPLQLSRALLAELACTTRESVSRALRALAVRGLVEPTPHGFLLRDVDGPTVESGGRVGRDRVDRRLAGRGQSERTDKGAIDFTDTVLGTTAEVDGSTTRNFVRDEKRKLVAQRANTSGTITRQYPLFDQLGSTVALTDSSGAVAARYVYEDPFGGDPVISGTASTPTRFAGGYRDPETGFYKFGERYYQPDQGRWTQRDPLNQAFSPREANRYVYAGQDPLNLVDPWGTHACMQACWEYNRQAGSTMDIGVPSPSGEFVGGVVGTFTVAIGCQLPAATVAGVTVCMTTAGVHGAEIYNDIQDDDSEYYLFE